MRIEAVNVYKVSTMRSIIFRRFYNGSSVSSPHNSAEIEGLLGMYKNLVRQGKLQHDTYQEKVATELNNLLGRLQRYEMDMEDYHAKMANWEETRESERKRLLLEEANMKQKGGVWIKRKDQTNFLQNWISRRKKGNVEPGVGKMVSYLNREKKLDNLVGKKPILPLSPKGMYLYGNVGSGKTMLMDMFYGATEGVIKHRRRFHFHEAMLEIHEHMHGIWKKEREQKTPESQPINKEFNWIDRLPFDQKVKEWLLGEEKYKENVQKKHILSAVADKFLIDRDSHTCGASILCFDEIQTVDVFAIIALSGILSRLLSTGTVLISTSNRAPDELNQDGMQRELFLDFLAKLEENCENVHVGGDTDYRRIICNDNNLDKAHYFWPVNSNNRESYESAWCEVTSQAGGNIISTTLPVMFGRSLEVPESCNGIARFNFEYLCGRPVGAADYIAIARNYHTVFISHVPIMSMKIRDKARRFITLIDELYNHHCKVFCLANSSIDDLFQGTEEGTLFDMESFQFETDIEDGKLRTDVTALGNLGTRPSTTGLEFIMSGQEELFAFRRAISRLIEMQSTLYIQGVQVMHPLFRQRNMQILSMCVSATSPS